MGLEFVPPPLSSGVAALAGAALKFAGDLARVDVGAIPFRPSYVHVRLRAPACYPRKLPPFYTAIRTSISLNVTRGMVARRPEPPGVF